MNQKLKEKTAEALTSVMPITIIVFLLSIIIGAVELAPMMLFIVGAIMLIVGMGFFQLGADIAMMPLGEGLGIEMTKTKKLWLVSIISFGMGIIITLAEPDLWVLAEQVTGVPNMVMILTVAIGVGVFLLIAILRILFKVKLAYLLMGFYVIVFALSAFVPKEFISVAFDSGGVTTGPITVPFIMAMGLGLASIRSDKDSGDDSFGLVSLCSIGPIIAVLVLGICYNPTDAAYVAPTIPDVITMRDVLNEFYIELPTFIKDVSLAMLPIIGVFIIFQLITRRYSKRQISKMCVGILYTWIGLIAFLTGVNVGFVPMGTLIGSQIASSAFKWWLVPLGVVIGYFIVAAEPAVHVLKKQVEEVSEGAISATSLQLSLSLGVAFSLALAMIRVLTGISIFWLLIPGYILALVLTFFVPTIYTGIAFDSGGVASGPMTSTFLLPLAIGACNGAGGNIMTDAFGIVAMVAMTPLIAIQLLGLVSLRKERQANTIENVPEYVEEIIEYEEDSFYE